MNRVWILGGLFIANICSGAVIESNKTGGGRWSVPNTWLRGQVPVDGDNVIVAAQDTVTFDDDMSEWANGIAGLTCDGTLECSNATGTYCLKTSADIGGAGIIQAGTADVPYPETSTMIFDFGSKVNSFECNSGLVLNLNCMKPVNGVIALRQAAAAGEVALSVDTDVSGDIWGAGSTIHIDNIDGGRDSESRIIAHNGIGQNRITVAEGLTKPKLAGTRVILMTRNIRIIGSSNYAVKWMIGGTLDCEINSCSYGVSSVSDCNLSGTMDVAETAINMAYGCRVSGVVSGAVAGVGSSSGCTISGCLSGCIYGSTGCENCQFLGVTITGCTSGIAAGEGDIIGATFIGNRYDLRRMVRGSAYGALFDRGAENFEYNKAYVPEWGYFVSYDHNKIQDTLKAWTRGGLIVSDMNTAPTGYAVSYRHLCQDAAMPCFRQEVTVVGPSQTLTVRGKIKIADNHDDWPPRLELIDPGADPLVDTSKVPLASDAIPIPDGSFTDWQDVVAVYTNASMIGRKVIIRCSAQRSSGDVYEVWRTYLE
jgi:hypothetical protein